jgi:uncharacterized protein (TIGR03086 family)
MSKTRSVGRGTEIVVSLGAALDRTGAVVACIRDDDLVARTDCDDWSVTELVGHVVAVTEKFSSFARGETDAPRQSPVRSSDVKSRYDSAADESKAAWSGTSIPAVCYLPFGTFDRWTAAAINTFDVIVHGWDLAQATRASYVVDDLDAALALDVARLLVTKEARHDGHYRTEVKAPGDVSIFDQVLALTGRSVRIAE